MLPHFKHHLELAAPLIGTLAIVVFTLSFTSVIYELASAPQTSSTRSIEQVGRGIDEFATIAAPLKVSINDMVGAHAGLIVWVALAATAMVSAGALFRFKRGQGVALATGVVAVPLAYAINSSMFNLPLVGIFGCAVLMRAVQARKRKWNT